MQKLLTSETTDKQLYELSTKIGIHLEPILYKDELKYLPKPTRKKYYNYIIHLNEPAHWVALYYDSINKTSYYFNSFADDLGEIPNEIVDFIRRIGSHVVYDNTKPIQNPRRGYCGQYCILFLKYMNDHSRSALENYKSYLHLFKDMTDDINAYIERNF